MTRRHSSGFVRWPDAGIGIPTGVGNGIVVVEYDTVVGHGVDGAAALEDLQDRHGRLADGQLIGLFQDKHAAVKAIYGPKFDRRLICQKPKLSAQVSCTAPKQNH